MKPKTLALLAASGMLLTSVSVYSLTPPGGLGSATPISGVTEEATTVTAGTAKADADPAHFATGTTLKMEGRMGHTKLVRTATGEDFLMVEVKGDDTGKSKTAAPVNLSIVIDRSGSMKGTRIRNAIAAATTAVDRMNDGDVVSVVTFDTQVQTVVAPTTIEPGSRERVDAKIRGITLGGDTCISCGVELGMSLLDQTANRVNRMILLSDGDANNGIRDVPGFRSMAQRAMSRGIAITTIGVDVDYNEKILSAFAEDSNGRHYFVENDASLPRVFETEAESLTSTVASNAEVAVELAPGVELDRVFDRAFRREGGRVVVPLGTFAQNDVKTVLLKVRIPKDKPGSVDVANVELSYKDLVSNTDAHTGGKLALEMTDNESSELDGVVNGRVQRSETASALKEANRLFEQGRVKDAQRRLDARTAALKTAAVIANKAAPKTKQPAVDRDFEGQLAAINQANQGFSTPFATPPPAVVAGAPPQAAPRPAPAQPIQESRGGKSQVRANQQNATDMGF